MPARQKVRYSGKPSEDKQCCVEDCRIRGRYKFQGSLYCYGHLSKMAVDRLLELGEAVDTSLEHELYERKGRTQRKRKYGNE